MTTPENEMKEWVRLACEDAGGDEPSALERLDRALAAAEARGFERAREMAASVVETWPGLRDEHGAASDRTAERIRSVKDDGASADSEDPPAQEPSRMCECGQSERAHDERGCFAWEWRTEGSTHIWGPSQCKRFRPRREAGEL
jgi:hypothetical protein